MSSLRESLMNYKNWRKTTHVFIFGIPLYELLTICAIYAHSGDETVTEISSAIHKGQLPVIQHTFSGHVEVGILSFIRKKISVSAHVTKDNLFFLWYM